MTAANLANILTFLVHLQISFDAVLLMFDAASRSDLKGCGVPTCEHVCCIFWSTNWVHWLIFRISVTMVSRLMLNLRDPEVHIYVSGLGVVTFSSEPWFEPERSRTWRWFGLKSVPRQELSSAIFLKEGVSWWMANRDLLFSCVYDSVVCTIALASLPFLSISIYIAVAAYVLVLLYV